MFSYWKLNIITLSVFLKLTYKTNGIPTKIPVIFYMWKLADWFLNLHGNVKARIAKTILKKITVKGKKKVGYQGLLLKY